ncbi:hypothetical protein [Methylobacterium sp. B1]|uniref:hypothetical protein n=1 Tax=Methylobacterium sp. B1 TaxID=91459 RepID=UPI00255C99ED|nr:hypothetical protein [Methylobacterium sp. B1]
MDSTTAWAGGSCVMANHVFDLGGEGRIARTLEGAQPVRPEAVSFPDPLHGA